jgi:hypothetical protein
MSRVAAVPRSWRMPRPPALFAAALLAACGGAGEQPPAAESIEAVPSAEEAPASDAASGGEERPDSTLAMRAQLTVVAYGPDDQPAVVSLALTDPLSRTTGVSAPGGREFESIPGSRYEVAGVQRDSAALGAETAPLVVVDEPVAGEWIAQVVSPSESRYRIDVRAVHDDGAGRRASAPWETIAASEAKRWRITYDPRDAEAFAIEALP